MSQAKIKSITSSYKVVISACGCILVLELCCAICDSSVGSLCVGKAGALRTLVLPQCNGEPNKCEPHARWLKAL